MAYPRSVAPFRYSSSEAPAASSDAQVVDYGVDVDPRQHFLAPRDARGDSGAQVRNSTPEDGTSLFGVVSYPWGAPKRKRERAVPVAVRLKRGGVGETAGQTMGTPAGGGRVGAYWSPPDAIAGIGGAGLERQAETAIARDYVGQL